VVPAYVTERCMPGVVVLFEGAWMDRDKKGVDRSGNPDFLTKDEPSPAGAFAYNTILATSARRPSSTGPAGTAGDRALHIFRRDS
jgi:anaerobic dimethyl sulfoxide reductase subunit A